MSFGRLIKYSHVIQNSFVVLLTINVQLKKYTIQLITFMINDGTCGVYLSELCRVVFELVEL